MDSIQPGNREADDIERENREIEGGCSIRPVGFVRSRITDDFPPQLPHLSISAHAAIEFRIFQNRNIRKAAYPMKRFLPTKNSVVAQGEAKHAYAEIPQRIADAIDQLFARKTKTKTATCNPSVG